MKRRFRVIINREHCKSCKLCIEFCPRNVLGISKERNSAGFYPVEVVDQDACTGCKQCALMCPDACIEIFRLAAEGDAEAAEKSVAR